MTIRTIVKRSSGLNTKTDPKRLVQYDKNTGMTELAKAVNVDIDETGEVQSRLGSYTLSSVSSHSLFFDGGEAFVAQDRVTDTAIYKINDDLSLTGVRSLLTYGRKISFCQVGENVFYGNGIENGYIANGVSDLWPVEKKTGADSQRFFSAAPRGRHIAYHQGRMIVAVDDVLYFSESYHPGLFRLSGRGFPCPSTVRMIRPVAGGLWVSDEETTFFIANAEKFDDLKYRRKSSVPAHEWSVNCRLVDLSRTALEIQGLSAVWASDNGLTVGTEDGAILEGIDKKVLWPRGSTGATLISDNVVLNTVF